MPKPEEILDVNRKWLPPSPHLEKVIETVQRGDAYIQKRGHNEPPLIMFEDGGVIELPKARYDPTYRGIQLISSDEAGREGVTKHRDVCGCVDEIKGALHDDPQSIEADPHLFDQLLDHAMYMTSRMYKREEEYREFAADAIAICAQIPRGPDPAMASNAAEEIKAILHEHPEDITKYVDLLNRLAEDVRHVASNQEKCLAEWKALAMKVNKLFGDVKGARNWEE